MFFLMVLISKLNSIFSLQLFSNLKMVPSSHAGAPNENIVQNHLNIALYNVFGIETVDTGIFLSPKNFSSVGIS